MSTAARSWWGRSSRQSRLGLTGAAMVCSLWPSLLVGQATDAAAVAGQQKARAALAATIQALGGQAWLNIHTSRDHVRIAAFFQGNPTGEIADAIVSAEIPGKERIESDKRKVVQIFSSASGWEITYKGKKSLPAENLKDHLRWEMYSLRTVLGQWAGDPATVVLDEGAEQVERRLAEKFTLMNAANDAVTLDVDAASHLPLRLSFEWRDPRFHDRNVDAVEFDNYHRIDGIATPFTVTRTHNGEIVAQQFILRAEYNIALPENLFDPDDAAAHLK
ncbi:MAG: hypothetical protein ACYCPO_00025 [Acidobacteriaceae bacterium]